MFTGSLIVPGLIAQRTALSVLVNTNNRITHFDSIEYIICIINLVIDNSIFFSKHNRYKIKTKTKGGSDNNPESTHPVNPRERSPERHRPPANHSKRRKKLREENH